MTIYGGTNTFLGLPGEILHIIFSHVSYPLFVNYFQGGLSA